MLNNTMKNYFYFILTSFILISGISCQKELRNENPTSPNSTSDNNLYLTRNFTLETSLSGLSLDTTARGISQYDNQKRLVKSVDTSGVPSNLNKTIFTSEYFYYANDSLPYRVKETESTFQNSTPVVNQDLYLFYNSTGQLIKDSFKVDLSYTILNNYFYQNNFIFGDETIVYNSIIHNSSRKDTFYVNPNLNISEIRSRTYYNPLNSLNNIHTISLYTFDNYNSPVHSKIGYPTLSKSKNNNILKYSITRRNLITNQIEDVFSEDYSSSPTYNSLGYPTIFKDLTPVVLIPNTPPIPNEKRYLFFYSLL